VTPPEQGQDHRLGPARRPERCGSWRTWLYIRTPYADSWLLLGSWVTSRSHSGCRIRCTLGVKVVVWWRGAPMVIGRRSTVQHCATPTGTRAALGGVLESFLAGPGVAKPLDQRIRNRDPVDASVRAVTEGSCTGARSSMDRASDYGSEG
jgi:hypothetical protein